MAKIKYRFLAGNGKNRDTKLLKDRQAAGQDGIIEEYLTEAGFQFIHEASHGFLNGVLTYS
jgi:hypothetical protein